MKLQMVAGTYGSGAITYEAGTFRLSRQRLMGVERLARIEVNAEVIERHFGRALRDGVRNSAVMAPAILIAGLFAAPIAAIAGPVGLTGAAIGMAVGLLGGGAKSKAVVQIVFDDGTGLVAICEKELAARIENDLRVARSLRERTTPALIDISPPPQPAPAALPGPGVGSRLADGASAVGSAVQAGAGAALEATGSAAAYVGGAVRSGAEGARGVAGSAVSAVGGTLSGAWSRLRPGRDGSDDAKQ